MKKQARSYLAISFNLSVPVPFITNIYLQKLARFLSTVFGYSYTISELLRRNYSELLYLYSFVFNDLKVLHNFLVVIM